MIAAQVVVVGLLVAIVVFTLLKPEGTSPLHGVDAPGGQTAGGRPPNPTTYLPHAGQHNGGGSEAAGGGESSPADDQYGDTLSLLIARLR